MNDEREMWCGIVTEVGPDGFIVELYDDEGTIIVDRIVAGVRTGFVATVFTTGELDEHGEAVVEFDFSDPRKELPN